uniref:Amelotin n=1 Tax=Microcebus murinus TaxID=30608 RepID=A0A8C5UQC4_MICMU
RQPLVSYINFNALQVRVPSLSVIPLTQMLTLGSDLHLLNPAVGMTPGLQAHPLPLGGLNVQQQLQPQVRLISGLWFNLGKHFLLVAPHFFTGLIIHPLLPGGILLPTQAGANPDGQGTSLPAGQAGVNPATHGTPEGHLPTPTDTDDEFGVTTPAGLRRGLHTTEETTTEPPNGIQ